MSLNNKLDSDRLGDHAQKSDLIRRRNLNLQFQSEEERSINSMF